MSTADKIPENKNNAVAGNMATEHSNGKANIQFVNNRPEAAAQKKLQQAVSNSPAVQQMKAYQQMANNSPQVNQLRAYQAMANSVQRKMPLVVQRVVDAEKAKAIALHIVANSPQLKPQKLKLNSKAITDAVAAIAPAIPYTSTEAELELIKEKVRERRAEVQKAKDDAEALRKATLAAFYAKDAATARTYLGTKTAQEIAAMGAKANVFRTYNTQWGMGSEYMFATGHADGLAQFVVHVHWNVNKTRSGVRLKSHTNKDRLIPGLLPLDTARADALGIPDTRGDKELLAMEPDE